MRYYLKEIRVKAKMRQEDVAGELCISESYYNQIENGERQQKMDIDIIQKLAKVFDVSVDWIIEQENLLKEI